MFVYGNKKFWYFCIPKTEVATGSFPSYMNNLNNMFSSGDRILKSTQNLILRKRSSICYSNVGVGKRDFLYTRMLHIRYSYMSV